MRSRGRGTPRAWLAAAVVLGLSAGCASNTGHIRSMRGAGADPGPDLSGPRGVAVMQSRGRTGQSWLGVGSGNLGNGRARVATLTNRAPAGASRYFPEFAERGHEPDPGTIVNRAPRGESALAARRDSTASPAAERFAVAPPRRTPTALAARPAREQGSLPVAINAELPPRDERSLRASAELPTLPDQAETETEADADADADETELAESSDAGADDPDWSQSPAEGPGEEVDPTRLHVARRVPPVEVVDAPQIGPLRRLGGGLRKLLNR